MYLDMGFETLNYVSSIHDGAAAQEAFPEEDDDFSLLQSGRDQRRREVRA